MKNSAGSSGAIAVGQTKLTGSAVQVKDAAGQAKTADNEKQTAAAAALVKEPEDPRSTKEKIIDAALTLFAQKGYSGTSVKEIAAAVGIRASSLYKHFTSKRHIFDTILEQSCRKMEQLTVQLHIGAVGQQEPAAYYAGLTTEQLVVLTQQVFLFYLKDATVARFRRMLTIEQYNDSEIAGLYKKIFTIDSIDYQAAIFRQLLAVGYFEAAAGVAPETVALNFYAPIFLLLSRYDGAEDEEDEALLRIEEHVRDFYQRYGRGG